ncbi:MAG: hypothetical protein L6V93_14065 [Clostridiales bacterium]|nr:MAG: hypothetical protein L6V93_14065 [Clostridiales bacterium]
MRETKSARCSSQCPRFLQNACSIREVELVESFFAYKTERTKTPSLQLQG